MEDTLGLKDDEKKISTTEWPLEYGDEVSNSPEISLSQQHLQVISKSERPNKWPVIQATFMEKLSFYRAYTCSMAKIEILNIQQRDVKRFIWFYVFNVLYKSLPMTYIYLFLSSYSPDYPLFLPKMVPFLYGYNYIFLVTGFFGLALMAHQISMYIAYFLLGIMHNIPWNRCEEKTYKLPSFEYSCLNLDEFIPKVNGQNITYSKYYYKTADSKYFNLAQLNYYDFYIELYYKETKFTKEGIHLFILSSLWILAFCLRNHISKRYIWQILHRTQLVLFGLYIFTFLHLLLTYENKPINNIKDNKLTIKLLRNADFDLLAESMTAPPVAHIISSRSLEEVKPSLDSALIIISNSIFYLFRAMTNNLCKIYCENLVNASIIYWENSCSSIFYIWPIYFSTIYTGDILVLVFFVLNAVVDYCSFLIAFQCLIQMFTCEWTCMKPWCAGIIIVLAAVLEYFTDKTFCESSYIFWTCISTLSEIIIIFWLYPKGRFIDDITFHYGVPPTQLRLWTFTILPIFYFVKAYIIIDIYRVMDLYNPVLKAKIWTLTLYLFLLLVGVVYIYYYYVCKEKRNLVQLFKPAPEWGPRNFKIRQLRKQFDSRKYIPFQASRDLSGHLIENTEMTSYKLDIRYDSRSSQSTFEATKDH